MPAETEKIGGFVPGLKLMTYSDVSLNTIN